MNAGRCRTRPRVRAKSRLRSGAGAVALYVPRVASRSIDDSFLPLGGPTAAADVVAGEDDDDIGIRNLVGPIALRRRIPGHGAAGLNFRSIAGQHGDVISACEKAADERPTDESAAAGNDDT